MANPNCGKLVYCTRTVPEMNSVMEELGVVLGYRSEQSKLDRESNSAADGSDAVSSQQGLLGDVNMADADNNNASSPKPKKRKRIYGPKKSSNARENMGPCQTDANGSGGNGTLALCLSSRRNMCINERVLRESDRESIDAACRSMTAPWALERAKKKSSGLGGELEEEEEEGQQQQQQQSNTETCSYYDGFKSAGEATSMPSGIYDLEALRKWGKGKNWCPYYLTRQAINHASVLVFNYQYMLDPKVAKMVSKELESESIIVFDEEEEVDSDNGDESSSEMIIGPDETLVVTIPKSSIDTESLDKADVLSDKRDTIKEESTSTEEEEEDSLGKWQESDFDDITNLSYEDVDYTLSDMAPPFINEDECLVPGEPVVRVEKAPQNSRRIFAGIDIPVAVDDVWQLLTDYPNLQKVVPNLVVNEVLELYDGNSEGKITVDDTLSDAEQCQTIASNMRGAVLKQVGGAKVVGINFSARTTLEVREWPTGMPDFAHFEDEIFEGKSRSTRVRESKGRALTRYVFPRPFALSSLPHKDISMQSIEKDDGEFRMYQGVWR